MTDSMQIPPVPPECDLRDFAFIPLEFERLFASDTWVLGNPEEKVAAMHLWCKSWHQVPSASLPDDDRMLAHLSGTGPRWKRLRVHALRGWVKCSDGRLYHPVVAEKALEAWARKLEQRQRTHAARVAALRKRIATATDHEKPLLQAQLQALLDDVTGSKGQGQGREETGIKTPSAAPRRPADSTETWNAYAHAFQARYSVAPVRNAKVNGMLARFIERVGLTEAADIAAFYVKSDRQLYRSSTHCVDLLLRDAEALRTEWATGRQTTDTEARRGDRTAATGEVFREQIEEARARERKTA